MSKFKIIFCLVLFNTWLLPAQNTKQNLDRQVADFIDNLQEKKIKQIGSVTYYCFGSRMNKEFKETVCNYESVYYESYLFWMEGSKNYVKKFDNCGEYNQVEIKSNQFFSYFVFNRAKIKDEEVKRFQTMEILGKDTLLLTVSTDHSCHSKILIFEGSRRIEKHMDFHDLDMATTRDKNKSEMNINYTHNNALKLVEWEKKIKDIITELGKKKSFVRITTG